jgi:hypothetical protein
MLDNPTSGSGFTIKDARRFTDTELTSSLMASGGPVSFLIIFLGNDASLSCDFTGTVVEIAGRPLLSVAA